MSHDKVDRNLKNQDDLLEFLDIPHTRGSDFVYAPALLDVLMDDDKLKVLVSKLRNKALW